MGNKKNQHNKSSAGSRILDVAVYAFCLVLLAGAVAFVLNGSTEKNFFGFRFYSVHSASMTPKEGSPPGGFRTGAMVIVKCETADKIQPGDIITFATGRDKTDTLTHRVLEVRQGTEGATGIYFVTKGDASNAIDPPVAEDFLIGKKVMAIPWMGYVLTFMQENILAVFVILAATIALVVMLRWYKKSTQSQKGEGQLEKQDDVWQAISEVLQNDQW